MTMNIGVSLIVKLYVSVVYLKVTVPAAISKLNPNWSVLPLHILFAKETSVFCQKKKVSFH